PKLRDDLVGLVSLVCHCGPPSWSKPYFKVDPFNGGGSDGPYCPHCGCADVWRFREKGRKSRDGLYECSHCAGQFTVTTKTPMHSTKLPLKVWLRALYLILISSKGVSSVILGKQLGVRQATAWKMAHAIRE